MRARRFPALQALRAIAALLVVYHHAATIAHGEAQAGPLFPAIASLDQFGCVGVDIFFVLSGFIMAHAIGREDTRPAARDFLLRRLVRVAPPFWLACALTAGFEAMAHGTIPSAWSIANAVTILPLCDVTTFAGFPPPVYLSWTLGFELCFYAIVAAALIAPGGRPVARVLGSVGLFAGMGLWVHATWGPLASSLNPIVAEFALGMAAWAIWHRFPQGGGAAALIVAGVVLLFLGLIVDMGQGFNPMPLLVLSGTTGPVRVLVWGVPAFLLVLGCARAGARPAGPLAALGEASYAIYLLHPLVLYALHDAGLLTTLGDLRLFVLTALVASAAAGLLFHRWIERPVTAWLHARIAARPAYTAPLTIATAQRLPA